jgi:hypothetical protein
MRGRAGALLGDGSSRWRAWKKSRNKRRAAARLDAVPAAVEADEKHERADAGGMGNASDCMFTCG